MTLFFCHHNPTGYRDEVRRINLNASPCPAVMAGGINGDNLSHYWIEDDGKPMTMTKDKPAYRVPSLTEIASVPKNGFSVVSCFSGCGGSCLGFEMAGYSVLWANEFIPAARDTYRANHAGVILDSRDIRKVRPEEILEAIGKQSREIDVLEGSPPCASFSTAGDREAGWGKVKRYSNTAQRTDDLFFEYARLVRGLQPKLFVAENVSGLVKGKAKGYFKIILEELKKCGYTVEARLLDAQWLGVPQVRQRIIFIGVRNDLGIKPAFPTPLPYRYSVTEAIGSLGSARADNETDISRFAIGREWDRVRPGEKSEKYLNLVKAHPARPCPTVTQTAGNLGAAGVVHPSEKRKFTIPELKRICGFPDDFILTGSYMQQWERLGRAVPPIMMLQVARTIREEILCKLTK
jgi:DNA (cytosine-5)-methyltransferase 1